MLRSDFMEKSLVKWLKMVTESPMVICGGICWEICRPKFEGHYIVGVFTLYTTDLLEKP